MFGLTSAHALTLGEVAVESSLGQPLNARIPVSLGPGEFIGTSCVSAPADRAAELRNVPRPVVKVPETAIPGTYDLRVTTAQSLYEPMYELQVQVHCAGTALLVRHYVLMLDLPAPATPMPVAASTDGARGTPTASGAAFAAVTEDGPKVAVRPPHPQHAVKLGPPIAPGSQYRVSAGDTLSTIAARVSDRGGKSIWTTADEIFVANPDAFVGGNQDLIELGSMITIPAATAPPAIPAAEASPASPPEAISNVSASGTVATADAEPVVAAPATETAVSVSVPAPKDASDDASGGVSAKSPDSVEAPAVVARAGNVAPPAEKKVTTPRPTSGPGAGASPASGAPGWLAALIGLLIGAGASLALLRERLVIALQSLFVRREPPVLPDAATSSLPAQAVKIGIPVTPGEPSMVVVEEEPRDADVAAAPPGLAETGPEIGLSPLFGADSDPLTETDPNFLPSEGELDLDLSAAAPDVTVDQEIGWLGDDSDLSSSEESTSVPASDQESLEEIDLQTLSQKADDDGQLSQTLRDALDLLETDYEDELTASQVIDREKIQEALERDEEDDPAVRTGTDLHPRS